MKMTRKKVLTAFKQNWFSDMKQIILFLSVAILLASCGTELRLAKQFVGQSNNAHIAIYFPETASISDARRLDTTCSPPLLDSLNSDVFLDVMYSAYSEELQKYKVKIYIPENPDDIQVDSLHWIALLTQVDITENTIEYMDYGYGPRNYRYFYPLKCINVASWFDFNNGEWSSTQFHELNLTDNFSSEASYAHGRLNYTHNIDTLQIDKVYDFAVFLGKLYASYTFDHFMNEHINAQMKGRKPNGRLHYDPIEDKYYYYAKDDGFYSLGNDNNTPNQEEQQ